jgi:hypothetical protein
MHPHSNWFALKGGHSELEIDPEPGKATDDVVVIWDRVKSRGTGGIGQRLLVKALVVPP